MTNKILYRGIPVLDGRKPTKQGDLLIGMIHEKLTGKCWHDKKGTHDSTGRHMPYGCCSKCRESIKMPLDHMPRIANTDNPRYLTSLDALAPLFGQMSEDDRQGFVYVIEHILTRDKTWFYEANPHQLVEALATMIEVECRECQGSGRIACPSVVFPHAECDEDYHDCSKCDGVCKRPLIDVWAEKCEVKG